jgi:hypothetical protein
MDLCPSQRLTLIAQPQAAAQDGPQPGGHRLVGSRPCLFDLTGGLVMGATRLDFEKPVLEKPKYIPSTEALRVSSAASGVDFKVAMNELNAPTAQEQAFLDEFAK